jgi:hypothetical protein
LPAISRSGVALHGVQNCKLIAFPFRLLEGPSNRLRDLPSSLRANAHATKVTFDAFRLQLSLLFVPAFDYQLRRRERRYDLRLPVSVSLHSHIPGAIMAVSENISSHGILLSSEAAIPEGTSIKLMVALRHPSARGNTHLTAAGKVLRLERGANRFAVAVCCDERPFKTTHGSPNLSEYC